MIENPKGRGKIILISVFLVIIGSAGFLSRAFSYDSNIAHPNIADLAARLYNGSAEEKLTGEEIGWLRQGAIDEDVPFRWVNHFYDPINNIGFKGAYLKAGNWAQDPEMQKSYSLGDYSWQRVIDDYQKGDKKRAFVGLGHIIHLISDMSVPAHTRNDVHIVGDSYEQFVKYNWDVLANGLENVETRMVYYNNVNQYFDNLANYSNNNFYSDDTIEDSEYKILKDINFEYLDAGNNKFNKIYFREYGGNKYYLYLDFRVYDWQSIPRGENQIQEKDYFTLKNKLILTDYTKHLFPKAVGHSAGIIKLFFEEVEKEQDFELSFFRQNIAGAFSYLAGSFLEKIIGLGDELEINSGSVVRADEETVELIMNTDEQKPEPEPEATPQKKTEITPTKIAVELPDDSPVNFENELIVGEPETNNQQVLGVKIDNKTEDSGMKFVFGPGGEANPPSLPATEGQDPPPETTEEQDLPVEDLSVDVENEITTTTEEEPIPDPPLVGEEVDITAPNPPELNMSVVISTSTTSTMGISWSSLADDLAYYNLEYKIGDNDWLELATSTTSTAKTIDVENYNQYSCRVNAVDTSDNISDWAEETVIVDWPKTVVINEIAWMGTYSTRPTNEWIELYNNTDEDIDLSGWSITVSGRKINRNIVNPIIYARSFYLIERASNDTVKDMPADAIFTVSGELGDSGENLILFNNENEIIDQVNASNGWFAGSKDGKYRTMSRINSNLPGNWPSNWQTSSFISFKGKGNNTPNIFGTPGQPNSRYQYLNQISYYYNFDENNTLTLTKEQSPYIYSYLEVAQGYTVKVEPGVVLVGATDDSYIDVEGSFIVEGSEIDPVIFTSRKDVNNFDCEHANFLFGLERDCNVIDGLPAEAGAQAGDWSRISVEEGGSFTADYVKFLYGGRDYFQAGGFVFGGKHPSRVINNASGEINISNSSFEYNYINPDEEKRDYDAIINSENDGTSLTTTTLDNVIFDGGHKAISIGGAYSTAGIKNSVFKNFSNEKGPFDFSDILPEMENNSLENNFSNLISLRNISINGEQTLKAGNEYLVSSIKINAGSTLNIDPGVVMNMISRASIGVDGALNINGTADNPVNISPADGEENWGGIIFHDSTSVINYANLVEGGLSTVHNSSEGGVLVLDNSNVELNGVELLNARRPYNMVYSANSILSLKDSKISWDNPKSGDWIIVGVFLNGGHIILDNTYFNEMHYGVRAEQDATGEMFNMTEAHFISTTVPYFPDTLFLQ